MYTPIQWWEERWSGRALSGVYWAGGSHELCIYMVSPTPGDIHIVFLDTEGNCHSNYDNSTTPTNPAENPTDECLTDQLSSHHGHHDYHAVSLLNDED